MLIITINSNHIFFDKGGNHTKLKIGKRNIKTAIAVFISVLISKAFKLEYPFFTVIAAIFSMENSIASTYKAGLYRLIGTLVGAFVGVIFIYIQPGNALLMGIGTVLLIFICNTFKWDRAVPIAGVMFAAIMLSLNNKNPLQYSFSRVLDTFAGIVIAVAVNYLIFPPNNLTQMRKSLNDISRKILAVIVDFVCLGKNVDLTSLRTEVIDSIKFLETYKIEFNRKIDAGTEFSKINVELEALRSILSHLRTIEELGSGCNLSSYNAEKLRLLNLCDVKAGEFAENSENIIYNYHVSKILNVLHQLTPNSSK
jgi:uncharacterized membrane protein YgaE (UPF0421/DUF939 family)